MQKLQHFYFTRYPWYTEHLHPLKFPLPPNTHRAHTILWKVNFSTSEYRLSHDLRSRTPASSYLCPGFFSFLCRCIVLILVHVQPKQGLRHKKNFGIGQPWQGGKHYYTLFTDGSKIICGVGCAQCNGVDGLPGFDISHSDWQPGGP